MKKRNNRRGFTLVELVIVIAMIAILTTMLVPAFGNMIQNAKDSAAKQEAKNAYTEYVVENAANGKFAKYYFYKTKEGRIVLLQNGLPTDIYINEEEVLTALFDNTNTPFINEADCFEFRMVKPENLYEAHQVKMFVTESDFTALQGGVNGTNGQLNTTFTNNWYAEIKIPEGAEQVRFLYFKTGATWGSAFMDGNTYLSGYYNQNVGGQWVTLDIPEGATTLKYGYLTDEIATQNNYPTFEYLEFIGKNISYDDQSASKPNTPSVVKHTFSVDVNVAPALGQDGYIVDTDYGYIILPENYSENAEGTRLIIVCHGAGASLADYKSTTIKEFSQSYWVNMGYAIMDMYACPSMVANGSELHLGNPVVLECYEKGYQYVMEHFNLKTDGIFVVGSSMGGLSSFQIVQSGKFPVLAQVANCPVIDLFKQAYCNPWSTVTDQREKISSYFGFEGEKPTFTIAKPVPSQAEIDYFINNFDKVIKYSPIFSKVISGDLNAVFDKVPTGATTPDIEEAALYNQLTATHPCPLLIIHNKNDSTVSYRYSEYFTEMLKRGGANVTLKLYDTGGHAAWDNGPKAAVEDYDGDSVILSESKRMAIDFFSEYAP